MAAREDIADIAEFCVTTKSINTEEEFWGQRAANAASFRDKYLDESEHTEVVVAHFLDAFIGMQKSPMRAAVKMELHNIFAGLGKFDTHAYGKEAEGDRALTGADATDYVVGDFADMTAAW